MNSAPTEQFQFPELNLTSGQIKRQYGSIEKWGQAFIEGMDVYFKFYGMNYQYTANNKFNLADNIRLVKYGLFNAQDYIKLQGYYGYSVNDSTSNNYTTTALTGKDIFRYPVDIKHYDITTSKIELLKGEELGRPFNWLVVNKSSSTASKIQEEKMGLVKKFIMSKLLVEGLGVDQAALGGPPSTPDGKPINNMEDIEKFFTYSYSEASEKTGSDLLKYLYEDLDLDKKFLDGFVNFVTTGQEIGHTTYVGDQVIVRNVDPLYFDSDLTQNSDFIDDSQFCREIRYLTMNTIMEEFWNVLTEEDIETIQKYDVGSFYFDPYAFQFHVTVTNIASTIQVGQYEWTTNKKIGILTFKDEAGDEQQDIVEEDYKAKRGESVEYVWVPIRWEGTRIGKDVFVNIRPIDNQLYSVSSLGSTCSRYRGIRQFYNFVDKIKPYQYLYNLIMAKLEMLIYRDKGKVFLLDISQIPKDAGWDIQQWNYFLDVFGIAVINSQERNFDDQATNKFGQYQVFDMSMGQAIQSYVQQLIFIKQSVQEITGITPQREGSTKATETASGVERSVTQSAAITESLFYLHGVYKEKMLQSILDTAKFAFKAGETRQFVLENGSRLMFEVTDPNFKYEDLGIFVTNTSKDNQVLQTLKGMSQQMFAADKLDFASYVKTLKSASMSEIEQIAEKAGNLQQERLMQQQQQQIQGQQQIEEMKHGYEMQKEQLKADTQIEVAKIRAQAVIMGYRDDVEVDADNNGVLDVIQTNLDIEKTQLQKDKLELEKDKFKHEKAHPELSKPTVNSSSSQQKSK